MQSRVPTLVSRATLRNARRRFGANGHFAVVKKNQAIPPPPKKNWHSPIPYDKLAIASNEVAESSQTSWEGV